MDLQTLSWHSLCLSSISARSWKRCRSSQIVWVPVRGDCIAWKQRWAVQLGWIGFFGVPDIAFWKAWSRHAKLEVKKVKAVEVLAFSELKHAAETPSSPIIRDPYDGILELESSPNSRENVGLWCRSDGNQNAKRFPCSNCRGRGYIRCEQCDIIFPKVGCPLCDGKGIRTCPECLGECVVMTQTLNESSWGTNNTISLLKIPDDEAIENMEIPLPVRKTKRVYGPLSTETREKIRKSLKEIEQRTGSISERMKKLYKDPNFLSQRKAAIKKAKSMPESRRWISSRLKQYFSHPENRRKLSIIMKGNKFFCKNCGGEGHRKNNCPNSTAMKTPRRPSRCRLCRQIGHQSRTCPNNPVSRLRISSQKASTPPVAVSSRKSSTSPPATPSQCASMSVAVTNVGTSPKRVYKCSVCGECGHSLRTCPKSASELPLSTGT